MEDNIILEKRAVPPNTEPALRAKMRERLSATRPTERNTQYSQQIRKHGQRNMIVFIIMRPKRNSKCIKPSWWKSIFNLFWKCKKPGKLDWQWVTVTDRCSFPNVTVSAIQVNTPKIMLGWSQTTSEWAKIKIAQAVLTPKDKTKGGVQCTKCLDLHKAPVTKREWL